MILKARVAQLIERQPSKLRVAGLSPVSRSFKTVYMSVKADVAQR